MSRFKIVVLSALGVAVVAGVALGWWGARHRIPRGFVLIAAIIGSAAFLGGQAIASADHRFYAVSFAGVCLFSATSTYSCLRPKPRRGRSIDLFTTTPPE